MLLGLLVCLGASNTAHADEPDLRRMRFVERGTALVAYSTFTELFDKEAYEGLSSGVPTTVAITVYVYRKGTDVPIAIQLFTRRVVYDLWDEVYILRSEGPKGRTNERLSDRIEVLQRMSSLDGAYLAPLSRVPIGPHHILVIEAELNPVGEERLAEMRRWLTKSTSESRLDSSSSFFGSFVSVFVNPKLQKADRIVRLRSQPFYRRKR